MARLKRTERQAGGTALVVTSNLSGILYNYREVSRKESYTMMVLLRKESAFLLNQSSIKFYVTFMPFRG